ncbi:Protein CBG04401 [Caenorhabditis briggsae]|uniref:Protein CBG04401 n=1 Tax=Caenorhabditis briggsae TaxID=6238 RepID=A8WXG0_CAEBR|nr:Protein CBG04401 [Caenorhabditis briggsae]CAP25108.2 Protein CBG04401 [Caenorhabditis briggsae]
MGTGTSRLVPTHPCDSTDLVNDYYHFPSQRSLEIAETRNQRMERQLKLYHAVTIFVVIFAIQMAVFLLSIYVMHLNIGTSNELNHKNCTVLFSKHCCSECPECCGDCLIVDINIETIIHAIIWFFGTLFVSFSVIGIIYICWAKARYDP